jgi:hypothetical protein
MRVKCAKTRTSDKEMAPRVRTHPGTRPTEGKRTVDERILAQRAQHSPTDQGHEDSKERNCFYCLSGWVFLGSLDHDVEEIVEAIRCRRCNGTARINR